jgi:hypothetical protein
MLGGLFTLVSLSQLVLFVTLAMMISMNSFGQAMLRHARPQHPPSKGLLNPGFRTPLAAYYQNWNGRLVGILCKSLLTNGQAGRPKWLLRCFAIAA